MVNRVRVDNLDSEVRMVLKVKQVSQAFEVRMVIQGSKVQWDGQDHLVDRATLDLLAFKDHKDHKANLEHQVCVLYSATHCSSALF